MIGATTAQAPVPAPSQATPEPPHPTPRPVALQPLAQQARQIETALAYLGQPLPTADHAAINDAIAETDEPAAVARLEAILDRYVLFEVEINPESRVRVAQGAARPELVEQGTQDIGFRKDVVVVFNALPARPVTLRVRDENGNSGMAAFVIRDGLDRLYSAPSKRLAPDLPFQPQLYRGDGETVLLPDGSYTL